MATPVRLIHHCHESSRTHIEHYTETTKLADICESAWSSLLTTYRIHDNARRKLYFFANATQGLFATLFCINQINKLRTLVLQPSYYTILRRPRIDGFLAGAE